MPAEDIQNLHGRTMTGKVYKLGNLEAWADGGSVVVLDHKTHTKKRVSVPDWQERMTAVAVAGMNKRGSDNAFDRDLHAESWQYVQKMQEILREAKFQGDVTDPRVLKELAEEQRTNKKYTMRPKEIYR